MSRTCIITSGAYLDAELEVEFGQLPPSFLPIGNRRLFVNQCALLADCTERVILSLPEDFEPDPGDLDLLAQLKVETVRVPAGLTLGQSVVYVINVTASAGRALAILHGDTLLSGIDFALGDVVSVAEAPARYRWGRVRQEGRRLVMSRHSETAKGEPVGEVLTGWFAFSDPVLLVQSITRGGGDFMAGLEAYSATRPIQLLRAQEWLDFGHASTYHHSRRRMTTEREFNSLAATRRTVTKSGRNPAKIEAEATWFATLPPKLRLHTPAFIGMQGETPNISYAIEYLYMPTLSDLFVFGRLSRHSWGSIFAACDEFLSTCATVLAPESAAAPAEALYAEKTLARLETHARARNLDLSAPCRIGTSWLPSLERMTTMAAAAIPKALARQLTFVHGDFCFSNILYDPRADMVRVIDPRGIDNSGALSSFGDIRYDIGKLYHSVVGRYDHIIAGYCKVSTRGPLDLTLELPNTPELDAIQAQFRDRRFAGMTIPESAAHAITVLLFLGMLPLHADDPARQDALLANAMRLFLALDQGMPALGAVA